MPPFSPMPPSAGSAVFLAAAFSFRLPKALPTLPPRLLSPAPALARAPVTAAPTSFLGGASRGKPSSARLGRTGAPPSSRMSSAGAAGGTDPSAGAAVSAGAAASAGAAVSAGAGASAAGVSSPGRWMSSSFIFSRAGWYPASAAFTRHFAARRFQRSSSGSAMDCSSAQRDI